MKLSAIIKNYRTENNLTMEEFAKRARVSKAYISMLEKNKHSSSGRPIKPSLETLKMLSVAMFMNLDDLLNEMDDDTIISMKTHQNKPQSINLQEMLQSAAVMFYGKNGKPISDQAKNEIKNFVEYILTKESDKK